MLFIDRNRWRNIAEKGEKSPKNALLLLAILLLAGGLCCLANPFTSGVVISVLVGAFLVVSGLGFVMAMFSYRRGNLWPLVGGILVGLAWLILGYMFITEPLAGLVSMAVFLAILFILGGIARLLASWKMRDQPGGWMQLVIGVLDLALGCILMSSGPAVSIVMLITLIGLEMLFSSLSLFMVISLIKKQP